MGSRSSKIKKNEEFKKIGEEENKKHPSQFCLYTNINFTNDLLHLKTMKFIIFKNIFIII